jgi:hypothetical protein
MSLRGLPYEREGAEESRVVHSSKSISLGVKKDVWLLLRKTLAVPHFSYTKRLDLIHERNIPVIYNDDTIVPVIHVSSPMFFAEIAPPSRRMFYTMCRQCCEYKMRYNSYVDVYKCMHCGMEEVYDAPQQFVRASRKMSMARRFSPDFYKRIVHFKFWLKRIQGKERHKVTGDVVDNVHALLIKDNCRKVHYWAVRNALKRLGYERFYDHSVYIMSRIRGTPLVDMTKNQEEVLVRMFLELEPIFYILKDNRVNMLSYPYVIKKLCEIKGWHAMARIIPTLKSHTRIVMQDEMWRRICHEKGWIFTPTAQWTSLETRAPNGRPH